MSESAMLSHLHEEIKRSLEEDLTFTEVEIEVVCWSVPYILDVKLFRCVPAHRAKLAEALAQTVTVEEHMTLHKALLYAVNHQPGPYETSRQRIQACELAKCVLPEAELE